MLKTNNTPPPKRLYRHIHGNKALTKSDGLNLIRNMIAKIKTHRQLVEEGKANMKQKDYRLTIGVIEYELRLWRFLLEDYATSTPPTTDSL